MVRPDISTLQHPRDKHEQLVVNLRVSTTRAHRLALTSFSPNENTGTKSAPSRIAILMNPNRFFKVKSAVPGCADRDSAAPPMTMVMADPAPLRRMLAQDGLDTEQMPWNMRISR